jgi:hypothetical protein
MRTNSSAPSIPTEHVGSGFEIGPFARLAADGFDIQIDGAVGYSLRLIPSNKVLGRFNSTREAWRAIVLALDSGRSPRTLVLDWHGRDGSRHAMKGGSTLAYLARAGLGLPAEHLRQGRTRRR